MFLSCCCCSARNAAVSSSWQISIRGRSESTRARCRAGVRLRAGNIKTRPYSFLILLILLIVLVLLLSFSSWLSAKLVSFAWNSPHEPFCVLGSLSLRRRAAVRRRAGAGPRGARPARTDSPLHLHVQRGQVHPAAGPAAGSRRHPRRRRRRRRCCWWCRGRRRRIGYFDSPGGWWQRRQQRGGGGSAAALGEAQPGRNVCCAPAGGKKPHKISLSLLRCHFPY